MGTFNFISKFFHKRKVCKEDKRIKKITDELNKSADKLIEAERKDKNARTGSH